MACQGRGLGSLRREAGMFCKDSSGRAAAAGASRGADGGKSCSRLRPAGRPGSRGARGPEPRPVGPAPPPRSQLNRYGARCLPRASPLHEPSPEAGIFWQVRPPHHCNISLPNRGLCHCAALRPSMAPPCHWRQLGLLYLASKALQDPELASPSLPATPEPRPLPAALPCPAHLGASVPPPPQSSLRVQLQSSPSEEPSGWLQPTQVPLP